MESKNKNIVICSDGTGNSTIKGRGTNVFKLFEAVDVNGHRSNADLRRQLAFYDDGVGTENLRWIRIFAGATGYGLSRNVKQLYGELCRVYEAGDAIYLFGFSRGAFTVRTLSGLINDCGILDASRCETKDDFRRQVEAAYRAYRRKYRAWLTRLVTRRGMSGDEFKRRFARKDQPPTPVRFLGVWDTVDAVGFPFRLADVWNRVVWQYKFETSTLSGSVQWGCQALALDEQRESFAPVLWDERDLRTRASVEQVWFAGVHSNVGGGYPQQGMSLVALDWMMKQAEIHGLRFVRHAREQYETQHSFTDKLYDPRSGLGVFYGWKPRDVKILGEKRGIRVPKVHVSAIERIIQAPSGYAPGNVPPNLQIVATEASPHVRLGEVAEAVAAAHGSREAPPLLHHHWHWIYVGRVSYIAFIAGVAIALGRASAASLTPLPDSVASLGRVLSTLITGFPFGLIGTVWNDRLAFWSLATGLTVGYVLSWWSDRQIERYYSGFWHRHRPRLRAAVRRTPPLVMPEAEPQMAATLQTGPPATV